MDFYAHDFQISACTCCLCLPIAPVQLVAQKLTPPTTCEGLPIRSQQPPNSLQIALTSFRCIGGSRRNLRGGPGWGHGFLMGPQKKKRGGNNKFFNIFSEFIWSTNENNVKIKHKNELNQGISKSFTRLLNINKSLNKFYFLFKIFFFLCSYVFILLYSYFLQHET